MKSEVAQLHHEAASTAARVEHLQQRFVQVEKLMAKTLSQEQIAPEAEDEVLFPPPLPQQPDQEQDGTQPDAQLTVQAPQQPERPESSPVPAPQKKLPKQHSEIQFGQKWLLIAGVITTVLAVGWFLKYSFDQNWIGPGGRVFLAYLGGLVFAVGGDMFRRRNFEAFGLYLVGGGIAMFYFATFAAFQIYDIFPQPAAFGVMMCVTALAGIFALLYDTKWLAVLGLIGGFLTPVVLSTGENAQVALMTYMTILNIGILSIAFFKQWRLLNYLGFLFTWTLFSTWYVSYYTQTAFWPTTVFLNIFFLIYACVPFVYHMLRSHHKHLSSLELLVPNSFIGFGYSFIMITAYARSEYVSIVTLAYTAIFFAMAWFIHLYNREQRGALVMLIAKAMFFLVLTVPILFSHHWITIFWALQACVLFWAALKLRNTWLYGAFVLLAGLTLGKFVIYDYAEVFHLKLWFYFKYGYTKLLLERLMTSAIVWGMFWYTSLTSTSGRTEPPFGDLYHKIFLWVGTILAGFLILNVEVSALFYEYGRHARFAAISVLWTLVSILLIIFGFVYNQSLLRRCAIGLFAITMLKVFILDMANVSTPYRVISFLVLGLMLIGASYLYHRFKDRILPVDSQESRVEKT